MNAASRAVVASVPLPENARGIALEFTFPGRRYHATPWGHHVNEGLIEWPPSPWRLLRALLATGYAKLHWTGEDPPPTARSLIEKLAGVLPSYRLPRAVGTHSRHYMPLARFDKGREQTTMVLDTWARIDEGSIGVHWAVELTAEEEVLLERLAQEVGYLGRSESWVDGRVIRHVNLSEFDVRAGEVRDRPGHGWEQVALLASVPAAEYQAWRERAVSAALSGLPEANAKGKPLSKKQRELLAREVQANHPADLLACLQVETAWLHDLGWNQPPGSRKVFYWRRSNSLEAVGSRRLPRLVRPKAVEFMLLSLATASRNSHALPPVVRTLPQGELLHQALLARSPGEVPPVVLSGRGPDGLPLRGEEGHRHAHLLHLDLDGDGHLDHALVWAQMGLDSEAQRAVRAVRRTFAKGSDPLSLALTSAGSRVDLLGLPAPWGQALSRVLGDASGSRYWRSLTPFVPARFVKARGKNSIEGQVSAELVSRGFPTPISIRVLDLRERSAGPDGDELVRRSRHFIKRRSRGSASPPPVDVGFVLELEFSEPVRGPVALGYASHFGLGLFSSAKGP